jgi:hypothetical protein
VLQIQLREPVVAGNCEHSLGKPFRYRTITNISVISGSNVGDVLHGLRDIDPSYVQILCDEIAIFLRLKGDGELVAVPEGPGFLGRKHIRLEFESLRVILGISALDRDLALDTTEAPPGKFEVCAVDPA